MLIKSRSDVVRVKPSVINLKLLGEIRLEGNAVIV